MDELSDEALATRARNGDREAFTVLLERHYMLIYRVAYRAVGSKADAEDVAQEVCIKLGQAIGAYRGDAKFTSWLYPIALNTARDLLRKRGARQTVGLFEELPESGPNPEQHAQARQMSQAVAALSDPLRDAVLLVCGEGLSHAEAASALGCSEGTISWRIHEARKQLKSRLDG